MHTVITLLVSLCVVETIHNMIEVWGMRQKVDWLKITLKGEAHGKWLINIDTRSKTVAVHVFILIFFGGIAYAVLMLLDLQASTLAVSGVVLLLVNYFYTTWKVNQFHEEIGLIIRESKAKNKQ